MKSHSLLAAVTGCFMALSVESLSAQTFLLQTLPDEKTMFEVRFMHPYFNSDLPVDLSKFSGVYDLYLHIPINASLNLVGSIPVTADVSGQERNESGIGDIFVGLQTRADSAYGARASLLFGAFLPTAAPGKSVVTYVGTFTNFHEPQRSLPNTLTLYADYIYLNTQRRSTHLGFEAGPQLFIPTSAEAGSLELFAHYGMIAGYQFYQATLFAELLGLVHLSESFDTFGQRFDHSFALGLQLTNKWIRPGVSYQIPIDDDLGNIVDGILGFKLELSPR